MDLVLERLRELGCDTTSFDVEPTCVRDGYHTLTFPHFVCKLTCEIRNHLETEECVTAPNSLEQLDEWKMELTSFLKELKCPYGFLLTDLDLKQQRFESHGHKMALLDFLSTSLASSRMDHHQRAAAAAAVVDTTSATTQNPTVTQLEESVKILNLTPPPPNVSPAQFFRQILSVIEGINPKYREVLLGQPLFSGGSLSQEQWDRLHESAMDLEREFCTRRSMLVTRLRATLQSFTWSERSKCLKPELLEIISMKGFRKKVFTNVTVADVLSARKDLTIMTKVSSAPPSTRLQATDRPLTKVRIDHVPDRGGRPGEIEPPKMPMPSWQQRQGQPHKAKRGGGRGQQRT